MRKYKSYWQLLDDDWQYPSLAMVKYDLKEHYDPADFRKNKGETVIMHVCGEITLSRVEVYTDDENHWHFSRPRKI